MDSIISLFFDKISGSHFEKQNKNSKKMIDCAFLDLILANTCITRVEGLFSNFPAVTDLSSDFKGFNYRKYITLYKACKNYHGLLRAEFKIKTILICFPCFSLKCGLVWSTKLTEKVGWSLRAVN